MKTFSVLSAGFLLALVSMGQAQEPTASSKDPFRRENLVAWCIVPFDSAKRTPAQRAEMLERLGIHRLAYDYRAEHVPSFDEELDQLAKHHIELTAWWFPSQLNDEARLILKVLAKHGVKTQLWVTGGGKPTSSPDEQRSRVEAEASRIRLIAEAAAQQGCSVGLYNHGGWFGEPENQLAIIDHLKMDNVGIVYNLHHGHPHLARFAELLQKMKPHLMALNLNGMVPDGDTKGQKILPLGAGSLDVQLLKTIRDSGYQGPIGILNHTDNDAEARLQDNLDGLDWVLEQVRGKAAAPGPRFRTWTGAAKNVSDGGRLVGNLPQATAPPLTLQCWARLDSSEAYNILVANHTKASGEHWELFSQAGNGRLAFFIPGYEPSLIVGQADVCDGRGHQFDCVFEAGRVRLFVDQQLIADQAVARNSKPAVPDQLAIGRLVEGTLKCTGVIHQIKLYRGVPQTYPLTTAADSALQLIQEWHFENSTPANPAATTSSAPPKVTPEPNPIQVHELVQLAKTQGVAERGVAVFANARTACLSCHKVGAQGGQVGPDLSKIGIDRSPEHLVESLLWPNRAVEDKYKVVQVLTAEGQVVRGYRARETTEQMVLIDPATAQETILDKDDIEQTREAPSVMPEGIAASLTVAQQADLVAFLMDLGHHRQLRREIAESVLEHAQPHAPAEFAYDRAPLDKQVWSNWQAPVNRDRLYDFYTKEANAFRQSASFERLLPEYPGIDGGTFGHWGNQNEATWESDDWSATDLGTLQAGVFKADALVVPRGVCVRLGDEGQAAVCFDPDTLSYRALWQGGFIKFSKIRHGFMHGLEPAGALAELPAGGTRISGDQPAKYLGFYRVGPRVVFAYQLGDVEMWDSPWFENDRFIREVSPRDKHSLAKQMEHLQPQWPQQFSTRIKLGKQAPYAIDTVELPWDNPWKALFYCGDHDFLADGSALVATMQGDVWHVDGFAVPPTGTVLPQQATWRRFASGLHHALGLKITEAGVFVLGRDQITRLHDTNRDGEADYYECFSRAFETSPAGHDYICGLQCDSQGNFYTASGNQGLLCISADGQRAEILATGFRNPDGVGLYPDGTLTVPCSEGEWTPASMICAIQPGSAQQVVEAGPNANLDRVRFYGYRGKQYAKRPVTRPELPLVYLPRGVDNSAGGQVYVDSSRFGPLSGHMIHLSFGTGTHCLLLRDEVAGQFQGAVVPLPGQFESSVHRGRFSGWDGQLYVSGMAGWGSYTTERGCFQRVRYTGAPVQMPVGFHCYENGIAIRFAEQLDRRFCEQAGEHFAQAWNYRYSSAYGSAEYSVAHRGVRGHDNLRIQSAHVLADHRTLFLELPELQLCNQLHLQVATSVERRYDLFATCNALAPSLEDVPGVNSQRKTLAAHPLDADMLMATKRMPNPWRGAIAKARVLKMEAGKNLSFSSRVLHVQAGEPLALTLNNPDVVPHNWALVKPGTLQTVGDQANRLVADPEAVIRQYVPQTSDVLCYTDIIEPQEQGTIYFTAPLTPGRYPYLCTFPGHWMVMNGEMIVEP